MDISAAIDQLTKFKKMSKTLGRCDLVGLDNESFTIKVQFGSKSSTSASQSTYKPVLGFAQTTA